jgi:hypothetical protein
VRGKKKAEALFKGQNRLFLEKNVERNIKKQFFESENLFRSEF